ncbi:hypothetical protein [Actinomadura roseirufa]|uniref:hypothetical protein n=1 Tax=Actinomadura roseirufa TaxID=2094049 RepID=UPI001041B987|nr:hypothetical protein [Actinomadura roseirufa]
MRMRRIGRFAAVAGTAATLAIGTAAAANAAPAQPAGKAAPQHFVFTKRHQSYTYKNNVGRFHAQVKLTGRYSKKYPLPWAFVITNKKLKAIARSKATCVATGLNGKYHDKHVVPVGYTWHSTVQPHRAKKVYTLSGTCTFRVQVGNKPGVAYVGFAFHYAINPTSRAAAADASGASVLTTSVHIAP